MLRILMVLTANDWPQASACLESARAAAAEPDRLTFGVSLHEDPTDEDRDQMVALGTSLYLVPGVDPWADLELLWQGEGYVLAAHPGMRFSRGWDRVLLRALNWCARLSGFQVVLSGYLPGALEPVDAVCAVAASSIDRRMRLHYHRGTPLRYARHPVPAALINPGFCFGPAIFFRTMVQQDLPLFLAAFMHKWQIYTLNRPVIHMQWEHEHLPEELAGLIGTDELTRFEARYRFTVSERKLPQRLMCGIMTQDMSFETRVPTMVRMQEALRRIDSYTSPLRPMCVTAWLTLPGYKLHEQRLLCFRRLNSLKNLPLICYTDPPNAARISLSGGNVQEYRRYYGLPLPDEVMKQDLHNYMKLCKPFLLARTRQNDLKYSHYIWLDFDYLRYPAYEKSSLDWQNVCHDRIMMAQVNGKPDTSMIVVPQDRLEPLCREISAVLRHALSVGRQLPMEDELWNELTARRPDWFEFIALPNRRELLALTMTGRGEEYHTT